MSLFGYFLSGLTKAGIGEDPFMLCITSPGSHIYKWGGFLGLGIINMHKFFGSLFCNVATLSRNVAMFKRRDVHFTPLCHVATWISNVATSILSVSVTSRRRF